MVKEPEHWYAIYTKPRWEKKVASLLEGKGIQVYCPLNKTIRQWSDRKKTVLEPLFKGYVFVQVTDEAKVTVQQTQGVVNFVYWNKKPAIVRPEEIETIQRFLSEFSEVELEDVNLNRDSRVLIRKGVFVNYKGTIVELFGNKAKVLIESLGVKLSATLDKKNLQVID